MSHNNIKYKKINKFIISKYWLFAISFILTLLVSILALFPAYSFKVIYDSLLPNNDFNGILIYVIIMVVIYIFSLLIGLFNSYITSYINAKIGNELRTFLVENIFSRPYKDVEVFGHGQLLTRLQNDIVSVSMWVSLITSTIASSVASFLTITGFIFFLNEQLLFGMLAFVPLYIFISLAFRKIMYSQQMNVQNSYSKVVNYLKDFLDGLRDVALSVSTKFFIKKLNNAQADNLKQTIKMSIIGNASGSLSNAIAAIAPLVMFAYGCMLVIQNEITIGVLIAFMTISSRFFTSLSTICNLKLQQYSIRASRDRLADLICEHNEKPIEQEIVSESERISEITASSISVQYGEKTVLNNVSFTIHIGATCILSGPNGSGKSTLLEILSGLQKPTKGSILINGKLIEQYSHAFLRKKVAFVPQSPHIFNLTLYDNLTCLNDKYIKGDISKYIEIAEIINKDTQIEWSDLEKPIGTSSRLPSGGETSRIALIRALLLNPDVLILDETFSSMPISSEYTILNKIRAINKDMIIIIVSHRKLSLEDENVIDLELLLDVDGYISVKK